MLILFSITAMLARSGVFNLPNQIWGWWTVDMVFTYLISGAALGWIAEKVAPLTTDKTTTAGARPAAA